jgi:two-component system cell cycle sensor histidine kinase/response regulator CckA
MFVLVVDDEPGDCQSMADALTREGFRVFKAIDAPSALRVMQQQPLIELLVTDISLPGTNGCDLARQLLSSRPDLKILFVSGFVGSEVCRYYGVPVTDLLFLRKPFTPNDLVARVRRVLASTERVTLSAPASGAGSSCG